MRIRGSHIAGVVILGIVGLIAAAIVRDKLFQPEMTDSEFLDSIHQDAAEIPETVGPGQLPPVDSDPSLTPVIEIEPTEVVMKDIPNTAPSTAKVTVYNRGKALLSIASVQTSCDCTTGELDNNKIEPGKSATLTVNVDPFKIYGFNSDKILTLLSNDPKNGALNMHVKTNIQPEFSLEPMDMNFGEVAKGELPKVTSLFRCIQDEPIVVEKVEALEANPKMTFSMEKRPEDQWQQPGHPEFLITGVLKENVVPGNHHQYYKIYFTAKRIPFMTCRASVTLNAPYTVAPPDLVVAPNVPTPPMVIVNSEQPFTLNDVAVDTPLLNVRTRPDLPPNGIAIEPGIVPGTPKTKGKALLSFTVTMGGQTYQNAVPVSYNIF